MNREKIESSYPGYTKIVKNNEIDKTEFNNNLESKINDNIFIEDIFNILFENS